MKTRHAVSDECVDDLVEICFLALPGLDGAELGVLLNAVLRVVEHEVRRTSAESRRLWERASDN
jgi:hypothetical protein